MIPRPGSGRHEHAADDPRAGDRPRPGLRPRGARGGRHGCGPRAPRDVPRIASRVRDARRRRPVPPGVARHRAGRALGGAARPDHGRGRGGSRGTGRGAGCSRADRSPSRRQPNERTRAQARTGRLGWAMRIAAVVAIVALGGWNLLLQNDLTVARRFDQAVQRVITAAAEPGSQTVVLTPTENNQASGLAAIRPDGSVVLAMRNLPRTTGTEVYETWVIVGDAAPVPVGDFIVDANGIGATTTRPTQAPPGAIIAVSREPGPGSTAPRRPDRLDRSRTGPVELTARLSRGSLRASLDPRSGRGPQPLEPLPRWTRRPSRRSGSARRRPRP